MTRFVHRRILLSVDIYHPEGELQTAVEGRMKRTSRMWFAYCGNLEKTIVLDILAAIGLLAIISMPIWVYLVDRLGFAEDNSPQ